MAAMLKTFDPITIPRLASCLPAMSATIAEVISGVSAATAVRSPTADSGRPIRGPMWSSLSAKTPAAANVTAAETRKRGIAMAGDTFGNPYLSVNSGILGRGRL